MDTTYIGAIGESSALVFQVDAYPFGVINLTAENQSTAGAVLTVEEYDGSAWVVVDAAKAIVCLGSYNFVYQLQYRKVRVLVSRGVGAAGLDGSNRKGQGIVKVTVNSADWADNSFNFVAADVCATSCQNTCESACQTVCENECQTACQLFYET